MPCLDLLKLEAGLTDNWGVSAYHACKQMNQIKCRNWFRLPENTDILRLEKEGRKYKVGSVQKMEFDASLFKKIELAKNQLKEDYDALEEKKEEPQEEV